MCLIQQSHWLDKQMEWASETQHGFEVTVQGWGAVPRNEVPPLHQQLPAVGLDTDLSFTIIWFKRSSEQLTLDSRPKADLKQSLLLCWAHMKTCSLWVILRVNGFKQYSHMRHVVTPKIQRDSQSIISCSAERYKVNQVLSTFKRTFSTCPTLWSPETSWMWQSTYPAWSRFK